MNPEVSILDCYGDDRERASILLSHARSLLLRITSVNIQDLRNPDRLSELILQAVLHVDTNIHVDPKRLLSPDSAGYRLLMRVAEPYNTREIIVVGADGGHNETTRMGPLRQLNPQPAQLIVLNEHAAPVDLNGRRRTRRGADRYVPT